MNDPIRDRVRESRRVPARDLLDHDGNPRRHPQAQRDALRGVLEQVGIAAALVAYHSKRPGGRLSPEQRQLAEVGSVAVVKALEEALDALQVCGLRPAAAICGNLRSAPMAGHGEKRSRREEVAIAALLSESTLEKAAAKAKVSERTLRSWLKRPDFLAAWREARRAVLEDAVAVMQKLAMGAAIALGENLKSANPNAKNAAALGLIDRAFRGVDVFELAERIEAAEAAEAARKQKQRHQ